MEEAILYRQLRGLAEGRSIPMHMPGHKRLLNPLPDLPVFCDLTEIEGADDLHSAQGILKEAMERTALLWGSPRTFYLVNGSTCGILAGIRALAPFGSKVIAARNCHRSVFHALELGGYFVKWIFPPCVDDFGICGSISPEDVRKALEEMPDASAVIVTSPTYEGILSDLKSIAAICHEKKVPLFVDEAHGAHLDLFEEGGFYGGALRAEADIVVQSLHKTLPSLTQTALLHVQGNLADPQEAEQQLRIFETSSPSYLLMSSLDGCTGILRERGRELFRAWGEALDELDLETAKLANLKILCHGEREDCFDPAIYGYDRSKILIRAGNSFSDSAFLAKELREKYGIEPEMTCGGNVLAMTGCGDGADPSGIRALTQALREIDGLCRKSVSETEDCRCILRSVPGREIPERTVAESLRTPKETVPFGEAEGRICGEYIYCYPPGVPVLVPGERIGPESLAYLKAAGESGTRIIYSSGRGWEGIQCLREGIYSA